MAERGRIRLRDPSPAGKVNDGAGIFHRGCTIPESPDRLNGREGGAPMVYGNFTDTGSRLSVSVLLPKTPFELSPQQAIEPSARRAQLK